MYLFGHLADEQAARKLQAELAREGIEVVLEYNAQERLYSLFVVREEDLAPAFDRFRVVLGVAPAPKVDDEWVEIKKVPLGRVTRFLIILSVIAYALWQFKLYPDILDLLYISRTRGGFLPEILEGEVWRLFTPMFLHFHFLHILFNMLWLKDLGSIQEKGFGPLYFISFVLIVSMFSNIGQYLFLGSNFGGMSGVVFGQLGFILTYKKYDTEFQWELPKRDVKFIIGWFIFCLLPILPVANMAHAVGLSLGIVLASLTGMAKGKVPKWSAILIHFGLAIGIVVITFFIEIFKIKTGIYGGH